MLRVIGGYFSRSNAPRSGQIRRLAEVSMVRLVYRATRASQLPAPATASFRLRALNTVTLRPATGGVAALLSYHGRCSAAPPVFRYSPFFLTFSHLGVLLIHRHASCNRSVGGSVEIRSCRWTPGWPGGWEWGITIRGGLRGGRFGQTGVERLFYLALRQPDGQKSERGFLDNNPCCPGIPSEQQQEKL